MFRKSVIMSVAAVATVVFFALTATAQTAISFTSAAVGTSGVTGSGSIAPGATGESTLNAQWQGLVPGSHHFVSQYHGTSCASYDAAPEFVFSEVMADSQGKAAGLITVKKPFANWPNRPHFLILHATEAPASAAIACGMIVAQAPATTAPAAGSTAAPPPASPAAPSTGSGGLDDHGAHNDGKGSLMASVGVLVLLVAAGLGGFQVMRRR